MIICTTQLKLPNLRNIRNRLRQLKEYTRLRHPKLSVYMRLPTVIYIFMEIQLALAT